MGIEINTGYSCYLSAARRRQGQFFSPIGSGPRGSGLWNGDRAKHWVHLPFIEPLINSYCTQCLSLYPFHQLLPPGQDPIGEKTFTHRRHLPIASIRCDTWSIRYLIVVAYGYLSRENWDLIEAMGKCRLWVNVAWVNVPMGICRMGVCRLTAKGP